MNIKEVLGKDYYNIKLYDDENTCGGKSHNEETLGEFMEVGEIDPTNSVNELQSALHQCGIKRIDEIDKAVEEKIQQKIWDIEKEFQIDIIDYKWDYKGFRR